MWLWFPDWRMCVFYQHCGIFVLSLLYSEHVLIEFSVPFFFSKFYFSVFNVLVWCNLSGFSYEMIAGVRNSGRCLKIHFNLDFCPSYTVLGMCENHWLNLILLAYYACYLMKMLPLFFLTSSGASLCRYGIKKVCNLCLTAVA